MKVKFLKTLLVALITLLFICLPLQAGGKGHLMIIGGGEQPPSMVEKFISLAGGKDTRIVIIPMASGNPLEAALDKKSQLEEYGVKNVRFVICNKQSADTDSNLAALSDARAIYFTGGDQSLLTAALLGTKLLQKIHDIYDNGGLVGGTSAGAAVMSKLMITGNELRNPDSSRAFIKIQKDNIEVTEGFGFVTSAIIDQHAVRRKRQNRLISLVLENPSLLGFAIDESTALIVLPGDIYEVFGEYTVVVYDASEATNIMTDKNDNLAAQNIRMHILKSGDKYDLNNRIVIK